MDKRIIISQESESVPIKIVLEGDWKAKEINRIERLLLLSYRQHKAAIRKANSQIKKDMFENTEEEQKEE